MQHAGCCAHAVVLLRIRVHRRTVRVQLVEDAAAVRLDRALRDGEVLRGLLIGEAAHEQVEHLALARGEDADRSRPLAAHAEPQ